MLLVMVFQRQLLKNNLDTKIKFLDFISDKVISFLKRSKYFISCSSSEPFGIVFLEALLYGCKTISPRSGGLLEISSFSLKIIEIFLIFMIMRKMLKKYYLD